ncbi:TonB-dependent receptor [candidate division KSB1 bacterium]|nr:TonB-dependent receptor [candidate division KSB1 bacterium]
MRQNPHIRFKLALLLVCLFAVQLYAGTTGKIVGTVKDQGTGETLPGVNIILEGTSMGAATDLDGYFMIINVPPGTYTLRCMLIGYQTKLISDVRVSVDMTTTIDFRISQTVLDVGEQVTVVAERPLIQKDKTSSLAAVSSDEIETMPVQEVADVLELQAGLVRDGFGGIHVRGGRTGEVAYWVDGIAATDNYSGNLGVQVENSSVQELQVISGTFNAEYGQAMSAVVNIVTKEGGEQYHGEISSFVGDYLSYDDDIYWVVEPEGDSLRAIRDPQPGEYKKTNPLRDLNAIYNVQASLSGPLFLDQLTFFATARYFSNEGYLYGKRWFTPQGLKGDGELVSMNPYRKFSGQAKLAYMLKSNMKLTYGVMGNDNQFKWYNSYYKYNPDANYQRFEDALSHTLTLTHTVNTKTFYEAKFTHFSSNYQHYVYENPLNAVSYDTVRVDTVDVGGVSTLQPVLAIGGDSKGYVHPDSLNSPASWSFSDGGTQMQHFKRNTSYDVAKFDITSQVTKTHQLKAGLEARFYDLTLDEFNIIPAVVNNEEISPFKPSIPSRSTTDRNGYNYNPLEFAAYVQDKMEFKDMIVNFGLRFDYFDSKGKMLADPEDPSLYDPFKPEHRYKNYSPSTPDSELVEYTLAEREAFWFKKAKAKMQVSPRFGIAYPITDRGVIHFSYGHFFQMPSFRILYGANDGTDNSNPDLEVSKTSGNTTFLSNADLKPQRTVMYEIGLSQQVTTDLGLEVTLFYRDVRDWVGASPLIPTYLPSVSYTQFENKDYSNVKGVTLALTKRYSNYFEAGFDYSFMVAEGSASNPQDAYFDRSNNNAPRIQLVPLGWDQRHTINGNLSVGTGDWRVSLLVRYWTGTPYTPTFAVGQAAGSGSFSGLAENSARKPSVNSTDLRLFKKFSVNKLDLSVFMYVYNVFDQRAPHNVWSDTGSPEYTLETRNASFDANRVSTLEDNASHPEWYAEPRQVQVGLSLSF